MNLFRKLLLIIGCLLSSTAWSEPCTYGGALYECEAVKFDVPVYSSDPWGSGGESWFKHLVPTTEEAVSFWVATMSAGGSCTYSPAGALEPFTYHRAWLRYANQNYTYSCRWSPGSTFQWKFSVQEYRRPFCDDGAILFYTYEKGVTDPTPRCLPTRKKVVVLDPGHGISCPQQGMNIGAIGETNFPASNPPPGRLSEDVLTVAIAQEAQRQISSSNVEVLLTKTDTVSCPSFRDRGGIANNANAKLFISVHLDAPNPIYIPNIFRLGTMAIYNPGSKNAKALGDLTSSNVSMSLGLNNRGSVVDRSLAVLKPSVTKAPSIILEVARLSGVDEEAMHAPSSVVRAATGMKHAVEQFLNSQP